MRTYLRFIRLIARSIVLPIAVSCATLATSTTAIPPAQAETEEPVSREEAVVMLEPEVLSVSSEAFGAGAPIPRKYSGEAEDVSPPLTWSDPPAATKEIAVVCDDPDAPGMEAWVHWVAYGISPRAHGLAEGQKEGLVEGKNSWGRLGYGGPMPPKGHGVHHYHFRVYAVDAELGGAPGMTKAELLSAIAPHVIAQGEIVGTYLRPK